ncbi:hypothetical protein BJ875DRAFT_243671 [Amylocarpus encephaloides]|uniref:Uncharacterized protein n=1 Tax=Amylocarpus encephaloides TaxID=45428 RepID=A0A9P7YTI0_9HELO|nr:hypothetical protein BJ875DRAFT_243671 [Amylocarpus encephaloides]
MTSTRPAEVNNGVTTSWIPFTTPGVSAPAACSSEIYRVPGGQDIMAFDPFYAKNVPSAMQCLPEEVTRSWAQSTKSKIITSLGGFLCPSLYTRAATAPLNSIRTIILCCPSLYNYQPGPKCVSTVPSGQSLVIKSLSGSDITSSVAKRADGGVTVTGFLVTGVSFADDILPITTTVELSIASTVPTGSNPNPSRSSSSPGGTPLPSLPSSTGIPISTAPLPAPSSETPTISSKSRGLSVGAKVGITIAAVIAAIALVILVGCLHRRRRRRPKHYGGSGSEAGSGVLEISREPRQIKNNLRTDYPDMDGLQAVPPLPTVAVSKPARETVHGHPGTKIHINESNGPHEMEVKSLQKYEMDAASVKKVKKSSKEITRKEIPKSNPGEFEGRQSHTLTRARAGSDTATLRNDYAASQLSPVSRNNTPDLTGRGRNRNNSITPVSRETSLGRNTPDLTRPRHASVSRNTSNGDLRGGNGNGRTTPGTPDILSGNRDARLDVPGGTISPMSTTERSFLDLSDLED